MEEQNKKQFRMMQIITASCVGIFFIVLISALILVPKAANAMDKLNQLQVDLDEEAWEKLTIDVDELIVTLNESIEQMSNQFSQVDVENLNTAIKTLSEAVEKMDIEELNRAITNLSDIIEPLARFMN